MRRLIVRYIPILLVALLGVSFPLAVHAQDPETYWDFRVSTHGAAVIPWTGAGSFDHFPNDGTYVPGSGFATATTVDYVMGYTGQFMTVQLPDAPELRSGITNMVIYYSGCFAAANPPSNDRNFVAGGTGGSSSRGDAYTYFTSESDWHSVILYFTCLSLDTVYLQGIAFTDSDGGGTDTGTLTRPLTSADEVTDIPLYDTTKIANLTQGFLHEFNIYDVLHNGGPQTVQAWSNAPGANVHAADAGSIVDLKALAWEDCGIGQYWPHLEGTIATGADFYDFAAGTNQPCVVEQYDTSPIGEVADIPWPDYTDQSSVYKHRYWLDATNVYIVTLQISDGTKIQYLVRNAPNYVVVGDTVDAGCVLGETIPMTAIPTQAVNFGRVSAGAAAVAFVAGGPIAWIAGAIAVAANLANVTIPGAIPDSTTMGFTSLSLYGTDDSIQPLLDQLAVEPTSDDKCNATGQFKDCLAFNPQFANQGNGWVASGNVEWTEPGVILDPGESVTATINLSSTGDYTATAYAEGVDGAPGQIRLYLGNHTDRYDSPVEWTSLQLAAEPLGAPDAGTFYTVGVQNTGTSPVNIASLCVTDGAPNLGPNSCYFNNQSFVQGVSGWTVSDGVEAVDEGLNVPDNGTISQNVMLNPLPGGAATYHLVVRGNWWYTGTMDTTSSASAIASIKYEWPDGSGYLDMIPITIKGNLAYGAGTLAFMADIPVTTTTDAVMNLKVETTTAGDMGVVGIQITDACLTSPGGGGFPGQGGGGAPPETNPTCTYVSRPQNNDPAAWLQWHWNKSEQFFKCDLMVLLNKMYTLGKQMFLLAGWEMRYSQSTLKLWSAWLGKQFFPWLSGNFRNMAIGQVTTVYQTGGGQCSDLFCVLQTAINGLTGPLYSIVNALLGILNGVTGIFFTVIHAVVILIVGFISQILGLLQLGQQLLATLITAYNNATPVAIPGLPSCSLDPRSSAFCMGIWVLDNTIFSGTGTAIIPMLVGILSIHLLIWVVAELKRTVLQVGQTA